MELVEKGKILQLLRNTHPDTRWGIAKAIEIVDSVPVIDPVKHARWERYHEIKQGLSGTGGTASVVEYEVELVMCSECTEIVEYESNYCPNCGAKMDKEVRIL